MEETSEKIRTEQEILARLDYLEEQLYRQTARIFALEQRLSIVRPRPEAEPGPGGAAQSAPLPIIPAPAVTSTSSGAPAAPHPSRPAIDWERLIAGNWFNRVGILALILAVAFFLKYAFDNQWLGPWGRVALGAISGLLLLAGGELILRRGYRFYAHGLVGGGICILYLAAYAGYDRYGLLGSPVALGLMVLITSLAAGLAVRYDALAIAVLGLLGGFLTPVLLARGEANQVVLFSYLILLNLGILAIAWFRHWRVLNCLAWLATVLLTYAWWSEWYHPERLRATLLFLTALFLIFAVTAVLYNITQRVPAHELDLGLILLNGGLYFGALHQLLRADYHDWLGPAALLLGLFYAGESGLAKWRSREDQYLTLALQGMAVAALTVAIPVHFSLSWVTVGWAAEGLALCWIGLQTGRRLTRVVAATILFGAILHWFNFDLTGLAPTETDYFIPLFNRRGASLLAVILAFGVASRLHRRPRFTLGERERRQWSGGAALVAALLVIAWVTIDQWDYFRLREAPYRLVDGPLTELYRLQDWGNLILGGWWAVSGLALLVAGIGRSVRLARAIGLLLLLLAVFVGAISAGRFHDAAWHTLLLNPAFLLAAIIATALAIGDRHYRRHLPEGSLERRLIGRALLTIANLTLLSGLSLEVAGYFARRGGLGDRQLIEEVSQSILYAAYGGTLIGIGLWRGNRHVRLLGLVTLALTTIKVFLFDLAALDQIYRVVSFIALGLILLLVSWNYQRRST